MEQITRAGIPLLEGIGRKVEAHEIDIPLMKRCITLLTERGAGKGGEAVRQAMPACNSAEGMLEPRVS